MNNRTDLMKMGSHIAELRKEKGYTQKTLGELIDVSDKTISKWEKGVVAPDITILKSLAKTLDVSIEELLAGETVIENVDDNTINAIDLYMSFLKAKLIKIFSIIILSIIILLLGVFAYINYNSWHVYDLNYDDHIGIRGTLITSPHESKIIIDKIYYNNFFNVEDEVLVKSMQISLYDEEELIYSKKTLFDNYIYFYKIFDNYSLSINSENGISKKNLKIYIEIVDLNDKLYVFKSQYD